MNTNRNKEQISGTKTRRDFLSRVGTAYLTGRAVKMAAAMPLQQAAAASQWWKGPLCISDVQFTPDEVRQMGPAAVAAKLADLGFNVHEVAFPGVPSAIEGAYLRAPWRPEDYKTFVKACRGYGIHVTPYLGFLFDTAVAEQHPNWPQRRADGSVVQRGKLVSPCYNSPWRDHAFDSVGDMVREYDVDGMFIDVGLSWSDQSCYCTSCRDRFHAETGLALPAWGDASSPAWPRFVEFRITSLLRFMGDLRARMDQASPGVHRILYMNNSSLGGSSINGRPGTRRLAPYLDILGNERANLFNAPPQMTPLWMVGAAVKILETQAQAHGQPVVQYCCFRHLPWDYLALPAAEYRVHVAGALANGGHPQVMGGFRYLDEDLQTVVKDWNTLQRRHPEVYCNSNSLANVALLWPQATADLGGTRTPMLGIQTSRGLAAGAAPPRANGVSVVQDEFYGWAEALFRGGYAYDVIDDPAVEEGAQALSRYNAVILPAAQCLSDAACAALEAYVRGGGHLVATGTTSLCNEKDAARADFALARVFGAAYADRLIGPLPIDYLEVTPTAGDAALLAGIHHKVIPAPPTAAAVRQTTAHTLAVHLKKLTTRYEPIVRDPHPEAAILANRYGSGTCVFLPGTFGAAYWLNHFPDYRNLLQNAVRWRCPPQVSVGAGASTIPDTIEVSWRKAAGGEWLLHLVNHTGAMSRPMEQVLPIHDLRIVLHACAVPSGRRLRAQALVSAAELRVEREGNVPAVRLPRLDAYEAIVLSAV